MSTHRTTMTRRTALAGTAGLFALAATACSGSGSGSDDPDAIAGDITVLTWRTDLLEDGTFDEYADRFNETYPDVNVEFEGITDYEGEVRTRMNTKDYGDVLAIPNTITRDQLPDFFEPLGDLSDFQEKYNWIVDKSFDGKSYGIPVLGNANGVLINKSLWDGAGVTIPPQTPEEFIAAMGQIKETYPEADPVYTNYKDGWPLTAWEYFRGGISADVDFLSTMVHEDDLWSEGKDHYVIDSLLFDLVEKGLTEADPTSTNWELSKTMIADGEIATMFLGSWAIPQMRQAVEEAGGDPADISYIPFPAAKDGVLHAVTSGDYNLGVNVNSENKPAARAWLDWFIHESGYAASQEGLSPLVDGETPESLQEFEATGVEYITLNPAAEGEETLLTDIDKASEIGFDSPSLRQSVVDAARTGSQSKADLFASLNAKWNAGRASVGA